MRDTLLRETVVTRTAIVGSLLCCSLLSNMSFGQQVETKSGLTDGLLELLEPQPESTTDSNKTDLAKPPRTNLVKPGQQVASGLTEVNPPGEGSRPGDALRQIHSEMLQSAEYLSRGESVEEALSVQSSVLSNLDALIDQFSSQSQSTRSSSKSQNQGQDSRSQNSQENPRDQNSQNQSREEQSASDAAEAGSQSPATDGNAKDNADENRQNQDPQTASTPGQSGASADPRTQLSDPRAMQEGVWGQLPDQVRQQMQSRMVERFLPAYQEQIEAYFRALLKGRP